MSAFRQKTICSVWNNFVFDFMLKEFLLDLANRHNIDRMFKFSAEWLISSFGGLWIISVSIDFSPLPTFITFKFRKMVGNQNGFRVREAFRIAGFPCETSVFLLNKHSNNSRNSALPGSWEEVTAGTSNFRHKFSPSRCCFVKGDEHLSWNTVSAQLHSWVGTAFIPGSYQRKSVFRGKWTLMRTVNSFLHL